MIINHQTGECSLPDCFCHEAQRLEQPRVNFIRDWNRSPLKYRRVTEIECAEYYYLCGAQAKEAELTGVINEDLKEISRVAGERLQR